MSGGRRADGADGVAAGSEKGRYVASDSANVPYPQTEFIGFEGRTHASSDPVNARERLRLWIDWVSRHIERGASAKPGR